MIKISLRNALLLPTIIATAIQSSSQTTPDEIFAIPEKAGGVYYAYPVTESHNTPAPKGYKPFYVSHYGRHGSRYLISDDDYRRAIDLMEDAHKANALTPLGEDVYQRLTAIWPEAEGRGGDLTPLGVRQHRGIASRMYQSYPEVFEGKPTVTAKSTTVVRCALSMAAFCESLKEHKPTLDIPRESSNRYKYYLDYHSPEWGDYVGDKGPWREEFRKFKDEKTNPGRLVTSLFADKDYVRRKVNPDQFMWDLYWIAVDMQNMESPISFMDVFDKQELFDLWQVANYNFYVCNANHTMAEGKTLENAHNLIKNIIESADEMIESGGNGATLRFGHDGDLIPLAGALRLNECYNATGRPEDTYSHFADFKIAPMAGNVQLIFFRDREGDVLVKLMLNERETSIPVETDRYPFYRWSDVKNFYTNILK
ncbi:MAG: histidine phosphatase family protein [Pseudoflavonifractor sp.]|nr:histidine phosphatase family protein [Pseudoflavonifractor sp.]